MDTANLKAFIAVSEQQSFSRAAEVLFITQPAVSKRIAALEQELNSTLFDRIGRVIELTQAGKTLLPRAHQILDDIKAARIAVDNLSATVAGKLSIGISHHISMYRMPDVLRDFVQRYPQVELDIRFLGSEEASNAVEQGYLEFALITLPEVTPDNLRMATVWRDPLTIVTATDHPLAERQGAGIRELVEYSAILPTADTVTHQLVAQAFLAQGHEISVGMETNTLDTIKMMVSIGLGWSVLPLTMIDAKLHSHSFAGLAFSRNLGIVAHPKRTQSNAARALLALLPGYPERLP
jgi:DNA-binding transcriptional LysR family regulator